MSEPQQGTQQTQHTTHNTQARARTAALVLVTVLVLVFLVLRYFVFQIAEVEDQGMQPILQRGDRVLVERLSNHFKVGEVVVFTRRDRFFVRRVVAVDGDRIGLKEVPMGSYFVRCDNRVDCPDDSLTLGLVRKGAIRGRVTHLMEREGMEEGIWAQWFGLWKEI